MLALVLGRTESVLWEVRRIIDAELLPKTVVILPPVSEGELRDRIKAFAREVGDEQLVELVPPKKILLFLFPQNAEASCLTGRARRAPYYREAVDIAATAMPTSPTVPDCEDRERLGVKLVASPND